MSKIGFSNNVEFSLTSKSQGKVIIPEPKKYDKGNGNIYERDKKSKGFIISKKDSLEIYGEGFKALQRQFYTKGVAEEMVLEKIEKDRTRLDQRWRSFPPIYLDIASTVFDEIGTCKVKTEQGGLKKTIDSSLNDKYDLTTKVDSEGNVIDSLETETIFLEPKEILLRSKMFVDDDTEVSAIVTGADGLNARAIPFKFETNSDQDNLGPVLGTLLSAASGNFANLTPDKQQNVFLIESETDKIITLNGKVKTVQSGTPHSGTFSLNLVFYNEDYSFKNKVVLDTCNPNITGDVCEFEFVDYEITILKGESLSIGTLSDTNDGIRFKFFDTEVQITESSGQFQAPSNAKCLTYKQAIERLLYIITGTKIEVSSELLETGKLSEDIILNGFWIRQFPDIVAEGTDEERIIQFSTSLKEVFDHLEALTPIAWWTEKKLDNTDVFRLESLKYTQQNVLTIPFCSTIEGQKVYSQAYDIKRTPIKNNFYGSIELGSKKGGEDYEEVYGLQSVSGKATFKTINSKKSESVYSRLSPYRLGDVDVELPRRQPYDLFPDEDTRYDSDIMCIRAKKENGLYSVKKWQDVYETAPKGIFGATSSYNLELTPARLLVEEHGFMINVGLYQHPTSNIVFSESNCNSSLITKRTGENELRESPDKKTGEGVISASMLEQPRVKPSNVDCKIQVTQEIEDFINGFTNGVPNVFGLVAINTGTKIEYFRMIKTDANEAGTHKFIESFTT